MPPAAIDSRLPDGQRAAAIAAAALELLRKKVPEPFDLTLLNLGATGFSEGARHAAAHGCRSIANLLGAKGAASGAPINCTAPGAVSPRPHPGPSDSKAAAAASALHRRDYGSGAALGSILLSKRQEREFREGGMAAQLPGGSPSAGQALQQQQQQQQQQSQCWPCPGRAHAADQEGGGGGGEEEGAEVWDDLRDVAAWRSDRGGKRQRTAAAAAPAPAGQNAYQEQQQQQQQPNQGPRQQAQELRLGQQPGASQPVAAATAAPRASYRNREAQALLANFASGRSAGAPGHRDFDPGKGLTPEEASSMRLAWQLQQQELQAAAAAALPAARPPGRGKPGPSGGSGRAGGILAFFKPG